MYELLQCWEYKVPRGSGGGSEAATEDRSWGTPCTVPCHFGRSVLLSSNLQTRKLQVRAVKQLAQKSYTAQTW